MADSHVSASSVWSIFAMRLLALLLSVLFCFVLESVQKLECISPMRVTGEKFRTKFQKSAFHFALLSTLHSAAWVSFAISTRECFNQWYTGALPISVSPQPQLVIAATGLQLVQLLQITFGTSSVHSIKGQTLATSVWAQPKGCTRCEELLALHWQRHNVIRSACKVNLPRSGKSPLTTGKLTNCCMFLKCPESFSMQQKSFSQNVHWHRFLRTRQFHPGGQGPLDPLFVHRHPEEVVLGRLDILVLRHTQI